MSDVQFEEDTSGLSYTRNVWTEQKSNITHFLEKCGVPEEYANYVLIGIFLISILMTIIVFKVSSGQTAALIKAPPGNILIEEPNMPPRLKYPVK